MEHLRSIGARCLPSALVPYGRRIMRRIDQMIGSRSSGNRPGVVLMMHVGRCGSTVLANLLAQNPAVYWDAKLHRKALGLYGEKLKKMDHAEWTKRQFLISGNRHYGFEFKVLYDQYPAVLGTTTQEFMRDCQVIGVTHYILLIRRNTLRHVVSHYASQNRGSWHSSTTDDVRLQKFSIDINSVTTGSAPGRPLDTYLQEVEDVHDEVREFCSGKNFLEVEYEEDIDIKGAEYAYRKTCEFLGIKPVEVKIKNKKVNPFPLSESVENFSEITGLLEGTRFEWMLEG